MKNVLNMCLKYVLNVLDVLNTCHTLAQEMLDQGQVVFLDDLWHLPFVSRVCDWVLQER